MELQRGLRKNIDEAIETILNAFKPTPGYQDDKHDFSSEEDELNQEKEWMENFLESFDQ